MADSKDLNIRNNRVQWIDCAKTIAIIAVLVDHCNGILYDNQYIAQTSYFSVSLFVLLSGMTSYISSSKNGINWKRQLKRIGKLFLQYALAVFIVLIALMHYFDLKTYLQYIVSFNIQAPYYFLVFYIQLLLLTPLLIHWCEFCDLRKYKYVWHITTLLVLIQLSSVFIRYTYILPVHGGGQYLAGGTYIILLGYIVYKNRLFQ